MSKTYVPLPYVTRSLMIDVHSASGLSKHRIGKKVRVDEFADGLSVMVEYCEETSVYRFTVTQRPPMRAMDWVEGVLENN